MARRTTPDLSLTEWVVLALVAESPTHGFAVSKQLRPDSDLGRVLTVHRPLVYRALDRLGDHELVEEVQTEPGDGGPQRTVNRATRRGKTAVDRWLDSPVEHVRDLRIEFLVKLRLSQRRGRDASGLVRAQRAVLTPMFDGLTHPPTDDVVDRWRHGNAVAARQFLDDLLAAEPDA